MKIMTYSNVFNSRKMIYSVYDKQLPKPVSLLSISIFLIAGVPWVFLAHLFGTPMSMMGVAIYLSVPVIAANIADKPIFDGKSAIQAIGSQVRYLGQSHIFTTLRPDRDPKGKTVVLSGLAWRPDSDESAK